MATISKTPTLVATAAWDGSNQNTQFAGANELVQIGANLYAGLSLLTAPGFGVFKSTDGGNTWTQMDAAHSPPLAQFPSYQLIAAQDGLYFIWDGDNAVSGVPQQQLGYCRFDPSTDLWGAIHTTPNMTELNDRLAIGQRPNGDIVVLFVSQAPLANDVQFGIFAHSTGVWGGANDFFSTISGTSYPVAAAIGPDGTVYVLTQDGLGPVDIYFQTISPGNVVSAPVLIGTVGGEIVPGLPLVLNDQLIFPFSDVGPSVTDMFVGSPATAPVWSQVSLMTGLPSGGGINYGYPIAFKTLANELAIFQTVFHSTTHPPYQLWETVFPGGGLVAPAAPALYYDGAVDPPAAGPIQEILKAAIAQTSSGISAIVAMQLATGGNENTYFLGASCPTNSQGV